MEKQARKGSLNDLIEQAVIDAGGEVKWVDGLMEITVPDDQQALRRIAFVLEGKELPPTKKRLIFNGEKIKGVIYRHRAIQNTPVSEGWFYVRDDGTVNGPPVIPKEVADNHSGVEGVTSGGEAKIYYRFTEPKGVTNKNTIWFL